MDSYIPAVKFGLQFVTGLGVGQIVGNIVRNHVPVVTTFDKVKVFGGTFVLTAVAIERTNRYVNDTTDELVAWMQKKDIIKR